MMRSLFNHLILAFIFATQTLALGGCMAEPTTVSCSMSAQDCQCDCVTSIDNPAALKIMR